jgi:hypothetical protein
MTPIPAIGEPSESQSETPTGKELKSIFIKGLKSLAIGDSPWEHPNTNPAINNIGNSKYNLTDFTVDLLWILY